MLDVRDITRNKTYLQQNHDVILPLSVTWTDVATKTLNTDGSFTDGTDTNTTIRAAIEPIKSLSQQQYKMIQGLAEDSTHVLFTLDKYSIDEEDKIVYASKTYRIAYVFVEQYSLGINEYLLKAEG